jgi:hypothetical protein
MRSFLFSVLSIGLAAGAGAPGTKLAALHAATAAETPEDEQPPSSDTWPRKVTIDGATVTIYQPQVEKWDGNRLEASAAVAVETRASPRPTYGVIRLGARTEVDKEDRQLVRDLNLKRRWGPVKKKMSGGRRGISRGPVASRSLRGALLGCLTMITRWASSLFS